MGKGYAQGLGCGLSMAHWGLVGALIDGKTAQHVESVPTEELNKALRTGFGSGPKIGAPIKASELMRMCSGAPPWWDSVLRLAFSLDPSPHLFSPVLPRVGAPLPLNAVFRDWKPGVLGVERPD